MTAHTGPGHTTSLPARDTALPSTAGMEHRDDIEGLRGLAVLSVFAVHSVPEALAGGFIGVDVFFVLSGYLIAALTLREQRQGRFDIAGFYARRLRRLLPALLLVLFACLAFAAVLALPADAMAIGRHVVAGAALVPNLVLWREAGYFDPSSELKPLLHLWSLGIEEQFYLVWPLLALALLRARQRALLLVAGLLLASFLLNLAFIESKPRAVFFFPLTRFWELLFGVLLATWQHQHVGGPLGQLQRGLAHRPGLAKHLPDGFAAAGVLLLLAAVLLINKTSHFPGAWALLPTLGTFMLLAAGSGAWINRRVLAQPVLRFYGRISYPLYLWHWPLLTFPVLLHLEPDWATQMALLALAVLLALATTRWVEAPLRQRPGGPRVLPWLLAALLLAAALGAALSAARGWPDRFPAPVRGIVTEHLDGQDLQAIRAGLCFQTTAALREASADDCIDAAPAHLPLALLWGDSFAAALYPGLRAAATEGGLPWRLAQFTGPLCPPVLKPSARASPECAAMNAVTLAQIARVRPSVVLLAGAWHHYLSPGEDHERELQALQQTLLRLRELGVERVIVLGSPPVWQAALPRILVARCRADGQVPERLGTHLDPEALRADLRVEAAALAAGAQFISAFDLLCNRQGCLATQDIAGSARPLAHDEAHLTSAGARQLVQLMRPVLAPAPPTTPSSSTVRP